MGNVWLPFFLGRIFLSHLKAEFSSLGVPPRYSQCVFSDLRKVILAPEFSLPFWIPSRHSSQPPLPFPWTSRTDQRKTEASSALPPGTTPCISTVSHTGALQTAPAPLATCPAAHPGWGLLETLTSSSWRIENFRSFLHTVNRYNGNACNTYRCQCVELLHSAKKPLPAFLRQWP